MSQTFITRTKHWPIAMIVAALAVALTSWGVRAQGGYPEPEDLYVNDYARLLNAEDTANVRNLLIELKEEHGIEATVVTIDSVGDYNTGDNSIESFATNLFNTWGIGDKTKNNGVLLLVAVGDREVRIEVGSGYENSQNAAMQEVINEHILPSFRNGNFSQGIYRGARAIVGELTGDWPPDLSVPTPSPTRAGSVPMPNPTRLGSIMPVRSSNPIQSTFNSIVNTLADTGLALIGAGVAALGAAGYGLRQFFRYRKRRCPDCRTDMVRLDEVSDDIYLDSGQKVEEMLRSIDYDVWKCPNCNYHTLHSYRNWFSGYKKCPKCSYRTVKVTSTTLEHATYTSSGRKRVTKNCQRCSYLHEEIVTIPKKTRSSSSSSSFGGSSGGSSFGGGSSSGGGASGKW